MGKYRYMVVKELSSAEDVTPAILRDAEELHDGWFANEPRVDWEAFIDRLSDTYGPHSEPPYELLEYDNAAIRKIQRYVRELRRS